MNLRRTGTLLGLCLVAISAFSHPMGNFSISHYARLVFGPEKIDLLYLIDMAEIPAFQEKPLLDLNGNGTIEESEQNAYLSRKVKELSEGLVVWLNGTRYPLQSVSQQLELLSGGLNLPTLRIYLKYEIPLRAGQLKDVNVLEYKDTNFSGRVGWKEIVVQGEGIQESSAPGIDKSQQLTHYPEDPAIRPPAGGLPGLPDSVSIAGSCRRHSPRILRFRCPGPQSPSSRRVLENWYPHTPRY